MSRPSPEQGPGSRGSQPLLASLMLGLMVGLGGCLNDPPRPLDDLNRQLQSSGSSSRAPSLNGRWLALITSRNNRSIIDLVDLESNRPLPVPGLNRPDAEPLAVSVDASGRRLALIRQREGRTELVLQRLDIRASEPIEISPAGVPEQVALSADGRILAVQVSRQGHSQIDLITLP